MSTMSTPMSTPSAPKGNTMIPNMHPDVQAEISHEHINGFGEYTGNREGFTVPIVAWDSRGEAMIPDVNSYRLVRLLDYIADSDIWSEADAVSAKILYPIERFRPNS